MNYVSNEVTVNLYHICLAYQDNHINKIIYMSSGYCVITIVMEVKYG